VEYLREHNAGNDEDAPPRETTVKQEVPPPDLSEEEALQLFITQTEL
jgi:hypothetical protein